MRQLRISQSITLRESESLSKFLGEIGKVDLLTVEQEVLMARKVREGDPVALDILVKTNLRFVVSVAKQYQNKGLTLGDLINEGSLGLIKAAKRFDETKGFKFISYAVWWIRQAIMLAIADQSRIVRLPLNQVGAMSKISRAYSRFEQDNDREPSYEELAEMLEMTAEKVLDTLNHTGRYTSFDAPMGYSDSGNDLTLLDMLSNEELPTDQSLMDESLTQELLLLLDTITDRERDVITMYFGIGGTTPLGLDEIGLKFNLTRERVRQVKDSGLKKMRTPAKTKMLQSLL